MREKARNATAPVHHAPFRALRLLRAYIYIPDRLLVRPTAHARIPDYRTRSKCTDCGEPLAAGDHRSGRNSALYGPQSSVYIRVRGIPPAERPPVPYLRSAVAISRFSCSLAVCIRELDVGRYAKSAHYRKARMRRAPVRSMAPGIQRGSIYWPIKIPLMIPHFMRTEYESDMDNAPYAPNFMGGRGDILYWAK